MKIALVLVVLMVMCACASKPHALVIADTPQATTVQVEDAFAGAELLPGEINDARSAAMLVATMPPMTNLRIGMEIDLHAAMYRAAYESNVGDFTRHYLLEPARDDTDYKIELPEREFRLRVLAALSDLNVPIAWAGPMRATAISEGEVYPGTGDLATRLRIRIMRRLDEQATVLGDVGDWTAHVGSSRQGVTATWDGMAWSIQRDAVRLFW